MPLAIPVKEISTGLTFIMVNMLGCGAAVYAVLQDAEGHFSAVNINDVKVINPLKV